MIYPVTVYGDPLLRKVAQPIGEDFEGLKELVENMFETMYHSEGVGLAAPQVGNHSAYLLLMRVILLMKSPNWKGLKKLLLTPKFWKPAVTNGS